jgi:N6-adenosine-specific RNA methylase IME4
MTMLAQYEIARQALADAATVKDVLSIHDELDFIKLHAQKIRDRVLLAEALAFQLRCERRLGVLLVAAEEAGQLARKGRPKLSGDEPAPATLKEIGVDRKLSMKARQAAAMDDDSFEAMVCGVRENVASSKSIVVDPVKAAAKAMELDARRATHALRTVNGGTTQDLAALARSGFRAKAIYLDPPWHFETRSGAGDGRSANTHYTTGLIDRIMQDLAPIVAIADDDCVLLPWIVDWGMHLALELIAALGFEYKTLFLTWAKQNPSGDGWHMGQGYWTRANPEMCLLATKGEPKRLHADVSQLLVAPVMEHSRKPDEAYDRIERLVEGPYLECYARRPRQGWVSWGNELEFTGVAA